MLKNYKIFKVSNFWSNANHTKKVEQKLLELEEAGYKIVSVSFSTVPFKWYDAYITTSREVIIKQ